MSVIQTAALAASMIEDKLTESRRIGRTEQKKYVCFSESDFQFSGGYCPEIPGKPFGDGDTVTVTWDGTSYPRTAKVFPFTNLAKGFYVGNLFPLGGEDTGEPFALLSACDGDGNFMGFIAVDVHNFNGDSTHRVGCSAFSEAIYCIDRKYIPEDLPAIDKLIKNGQIGHAEPGKVLTFNGDVTGKTVIELNGMAYVKISDKPYDLTKLEKFGLGYDPEIAEAEGIPPYYEVPKEMYTIESDADYSAVFVDNQIAIVSYSRKVEAMAFDVGVYVLAICSVDRIVAWVSRLEFAGTIHPVDPKYIPENLPVIDKLSKSGQIGSTVTPVYTFDGDPTGKVVREDTILLQVRITEDTPDLNNLVKGSVLLDGETIEITKSSITVETADFGQVVVAKDLGRLVWRVTAPMDGYPEPGLYVACYEDTYVTRLEFAETIHPINPKYLPEGGVGHTEKEVYTYDGNGSTETLDKWQMYKITDGEIELSTIVRVVATAGNQTIEAAKDELIIETYNTGVQKVYVKYEGATWPIIMLYGGTWILDDSGVYVSRIETETIHPIDQKYLPDNVVDCDALTCTTTDGKETVMSFSEAILQLFVESLFSSGKAKVKEVIDNNGAFKQAVSGKQSIILKQTNAKEIVYYPVTHSISIASSEPAQLSGFTIFPLVGNVEGSDLEGYCEIKFNIQFTTNDQNVNLMVQATPIQT